MKLAGEYRFDAPIEEVWKALLDPEVLAATMPGCEKLDLVDGTYLGKLNVKVGPVQGKFDGKVTLEDIRKEEGYTVLVDGRGAAGFVNANAKVDLAVADGGTVLTYDADAKVGGRIASVGQRLLEASAKAIISQSLEGLHENVKIRAAHAASLAAPAAEGESDSTDTKPPASAENAAEEVLGIVQPAVAKRAVAKPVVAPPPLKKVTEGELAAAVAREVGKSLLPQPVLYLLVFGLGVVAGWILKSMM